MTRLDPETQDISASQLKFAVDSKLVMSNAAKIIKERGGLHKNRKQAKLQLTLEMYFKYGYKPNKIASKLRLCNT